MKVKKIRNINLWNISLRFEEVCMVICGFFLCISITLMVFFRYILKINSYGLEEIILMFAVWLYFMGGAYGSYENSHVSANIVYFIIKDKKKLKVMAIIKDILTTLLCLTATFLEAQSFLWTLKMNPKSPVHRLPMIIPNFAVLFGLCLMSYYYLVYLVNDFKNIKKN